MPSSSCSPSSPVRAGLRAGVVLAAAGVALGAGGAGSASAAPVAPPAGPAQVPALSQLGNLDPTTAGEGLMHGVTQAVGPVKGLKLDPLAGTGVDPLDNAVGTQVADFKPVSSAVATGPITQGGSVADLPVVGPVAGVLPG
ncbi:hypothetical protein [Streptomyces sp. NPDC059063]|uniref:hypothetical protein n=1 Tax=unclassified Streptomyces TaxID=2593676 RepID=UPI0036CDC17F